MKPMSERKMDMNRGEPDSDGFFPESAHHKKLGRVGEITCPKYPDTEEMTLADSNQAVREANKNKPKPGFRH
jgi:hypothetical protein